MSAPQRVVVVGTGWIAQQVHLPHFATSSSARLHGVFDADHQRALRIAKQYGVVAYGSLEDALSSAEVIVVCTPPSTHRAIAVPALQKGLSVICEKPLATSSEDAWAMYEAAIAGGGRLFCCLTNRYRADVMEMREQVAKGAIGAAQYLRASWLRGAGIPQTPGAAESGVLWDLGAHLVDLMMWITQWPEPVAVHANEMRTSTATVSSADWYAPGEVAHLERGPETAVLSCSFPQGAAAHVELSWAAHGSADCTSLLLVGSEGSLQLNTVFGFSPDRQRVAGPALVLNKNGQSIALAIQDRQHREYAHQLDTFVNAIHANDDSWIFPLQYAVRSIEVLERARTTKNETAREAVHG